MAKPAAKKSASKNPVAKKSAPKGLPVVLVGTRKGAFVLTGDANRRKWQVTGPHFLGNVIQHFLLDPRDQRTLLIAAKTGHLGPTVFRSTDWGKRWKEASRPPAFPKAAEGETGRAVKSVFWLTPGLSSQPKVWYAGTSPDGLFRCDDGGDTWDEVKGFNDHPLRQTWMKDGGSADGLLTHSIAIDPRDAKHIYLSISTGGTFESRDGGADWAPLNRGVVADFIPLKDPEWGHDPHLFVMHPADPDRLYQQNHCGIYRLDRAKGETWTRIGANMPKKVGDIGFPLVVHPRNVDTAWVFPMDGTSVWPRTSPEGKPACYVTRNGGKSWQRQDRGLPQEHAYWTVMRQSMCDDGRDPLGLYLGNTAGEVWMSRDEGEKWENIARHLPEIYSVATGVRAK